MNEALFAATGLEVDPALLAAFQADGISAPTAVQQAAIGPILAGQHVIIQSGTGTGKTLAYLLPILQRLRATGLAAIGHLPSAELRILAVLWHLAETWGKVVVDGVLIPFPFTHAALGQLMGARRPTVSLALVNLHTEGLVRRLDDGTWLLPAGSDVALREMLAGRSPVPEAVIRARVIRHAAAGQRDGH